MSILITRNIPEPGLEVLREAGVAFTIGQRDEEKGITKESILRAWPGHRVLLSLLTETVDRELLLGLGSDLLGVANMAVGYNNVDVVAASEMKIPVSNTPGVLTESTADLAWALLLAAARHIPQAHAYMTAGRYGIWGPNMYLGADVGLGASGRRKVLGIVGYGRIGRAVARRAAGFDMDVIAYGRDRGPIDVDPQATFAELDDLLGRSDFVSLHTPLTDATRHMIGRDQLESMKSTAILINTARGPVVDEDALVQALRDRQIAAAGLDVYEKEPAMADGLAELDNLVRLPHIASATHGTRGRMAVIAAQNALAMLAGHEAPNVINAEVY